MGFPAKDTKAAKGEMTSLTSPRRGTIHLGTRVVRPSDSEIHFGNRSYQLPDVNGSWYQPTGKQPKNLISAGGEVAAAEPDQLHRTKDCAEHDQGPPVVQTADRR